MWVPLTAALLSASFALSPSHDWTNSQNNRAGEVLSSHSTGENKHREADLRRERMQALPEAFWHQGHDFSPELRDPGLLKTKNNCKAKEKKWDMLRSSKLDLLTWKYTCPQALLAIPNSALLLNQSGRWVNSKGTESNSAELLTRNRLKDLQHMKVKQ